MPLFTTLRKTRTSSAYVSAVPEIRRAGPSDLEDLMNLRLELHKAYPDSWMQSYDEVAAKSKSYWDSWLGRYLFDSKNVLFVAVDGGEILAVDPGEMSAGKLVGMVAGLRSDFQRARHVATVIGLGVLPDYLKQGLGGKLMGELVNWARSDPDISRLELEVFADIPAVDFYKKAGFEVEGTRRKFAKKVDGGFQDAYDMALFVK